GDRLPSVRQLSAREQVSVATVLQAYLHLESRGLIETRPQSGHYVRRRERTRPAEPQVSRPAAQASEVSISARIRLAYRTVNDPRIVPLGAASIAPQLLPTRRLNRELSQLAREIGEDAIEYDMPPGSLALRQQVARRSLDWGCALSPEDIIITCGASEAVFLSLSAVARRGDTVAIESPAYYGMLQAIEAQELRALELPMHPRHGMELDALEAALNKRKVAAVLAVPSFSNPMGSCMPDENRRRLVEMLAARGIPFIEDDIYGDLHHGPTRPQPVKAYDRDGGVLLCGSFSKTLAPGYRVGWVAPGRYRDKVELLKYAHTVATPTLPSLAIAEFLRGGGYDRHLRTLRRQLASQVQRMTEGVGEHFPEGTCVTRPEGGSLLWVELPRGVDSLELHTRALAAGIGIIPGPLFSAQKRYGHFIRLNCGFPWSPRLDGALATLGSLTRALMPTR
ncbi:MAG: PLP-dependent aminotransferase family protein, partial [Cystobacter sp.]